MRIMTPIGNMYDRSLSTPNEPDNIESKWKKKPSKPATTLDVSMTNYTPSTLNLKFWKKKYEIKFEKDTNTSEKKPGSNQFR